FERSSVSGREDALPFADEDLRACSIRRALHERDDECGGDCGGERRQQYPSPAPQDIDIVSKPERRLALGNGVARGIAALHVHRHRAGTLSAAPEVPIASWCLQRCAL